MNRNHVILYTLLFLVTALPLPSQERVYVHTDASHFFPGERIWMKAYVLDTALFPSDSSLYVYAELTGKDGMTEKRVKVIRDFGLFGGYMDVPEYLENGIYYLRAYTMAMKDNPASHFVKPLAIGRSILPKSTETPFVSSPDTCIIGIDAQKSIDSCTVKLFPTDLHPGELADVSVSVSLLGKGRGITAGISDYFGKAAHSASREPSPQFEGSSVIRGRVLTEFLGKGVENVEISAISPQSGIYFKTISGPGGYFTFTGMDYPEGTDYVLQCRDSKGRNRYALTVEETVFPPCENLEEMAHWALCGKDEDIYSALEINDGNTLLSAAVVTSSAVEVLPEARFGTQSDFSFGPKQIEEMGATCMHEILRRIPGIFIRDEVAYIRAATSIYADNPAAIAIDGVILDEEFDLDVINMPDVERVDVFLGGSTVIWGARGGSGVISVTTKKGNYIGDAADNLPNVKKVHPLGWQRPESFVKWREEHPQSRTMLWIPLVTNPVFSFPLYPDTGQFMISVEGITSEGRIIHRTSIL